MMIDLRTEQRVLITVHELAEYCRMSPKSIYRHIQKGALKVVHVGPFQQVRIAIEEARRYAAAVPVNGNGS